MSGRHSLRQPLAALLPEKIGVGTTTCVRNSYKYYVACKLMSDVADVQRKAREGAAQQGK